MSRIRKRQKKSVKNCTITALHQSSRMKTRSRLWREKSVTKLDGWVQQRRGRRERSNSETWASGRNQVGLFLALSWEKGQHHHRLRLFSQPHIHCQSSSNWRTLRSQDNGIRESTAHTEYSTVDALRSAEAKRARNGTATRCQACGNIRNAPWLWQSSTISGPCPHNKSFLSSTLQEEIRYLCLSLLYCIYLNGMGHVLVIPRVSIYEVVLYPPRWTTLCYWG